MPFTAQPRRDWAPLVSKTLYFAGMAPADVGLLDLACSKKTFGRNHAMAGAEIYTGGKSVFLFHSPQSHIGFYRIVAKPLHRPRC
jgi:hypothetical protein